MSCKTMNIDLANVPPVPIQIGVAGENAFRTITFDASTWGADFPDATYTVVYKRSDGYIYPVLVNAAADAIVWSPTDTDTAVSGNGQIEVRLLDGETIGKTIVMQTFVAPSLTGDESEPSRPAPDWVNDVAADADRAEAAVEHYPKIVNGVWYVWDVQSEDFISTGIEAQGEEGYSPTVTITAIDGGHRVTITDADGAHTFDVLDGVGGSDAVESVNGKTGVVVLDATDVHALPDSTVIPVVPQMATAADMSDWTSGKTVDAAVLKEDFTAAALELALELDDLSVNKADRTDIPTAVSELANDSGFVTAQQAAAAAPVQSVNGMTGAVTIPTGSSDAVLYTPMSLTDAQQEQARENIGAAGADDVDKLSSVVTGQSKTSTVEEVENSKAFAAGRINYSASKGDKITVNVSGSAFSGSSATLYFWYAGASSHTTIGTITLGTDTDYTLSDDITAVEVYSANGGAGTVRFEIVKTSGTSGGLVGAVSALNSSVSDLSDIIGVGGASTTVTHGGGNLTVNLDFSAESGETIGITPSGAALTGTTCFLYFRYVGDSGNTRIGAISVGDETRITLERAIQTVSIYASGAAAGDASLAVHTVGIKDNVDDLVASANPLKGKKLNFLGDSITYGSGSSHPFTYYLEQQHGCTCRNYGIAGSTVQYDANRNPMCVRYADMDDDADIVAVMGGTNDYWNNKPLGQMGDTVNTTFYGALDIMIRGLIAKYPSALFYMVTPPHGDNGGNFDGSAKTNAGSMQDIANAVEEVAAKYSIPVLDVFNAGGLYPSISDQKDLYYSDGVHLNTEGQKKLAQMHAAFILSGGLHSGRANRYDYATEAWVTDRGYQTAAQVQTAIAAAAELPSGGTTGDFLRKTASGVAWETVQTYQGGSY